MTKCGRYGPTTFDYSAASIRDSVKRSLERIQTAYLDVVYLHDVEFVATPFLKKANGNHAAALTDEKADYGLLEGEEAVIRGEGDRKILEAFAELQKMKEEGLVKQVGITGMLSSRICPFCLFDVPCKGYPLPTLLRLALLILHTAPFQPVDVILSYSHMSLQNSTFAEFIPVFRERAKVGHLLAASPFSMGLLTPSGPPAWHPAPASLREAVGNVREKCERAIPDLALGYSIRKSIEAGVPLVAGFSATKEVHECVRVWREVKAGIDDENRRKDEEHGRSLIEESNYLDWSWSSP